MNPRILLIAALAGLVAVACAHTSDQTTTMSGASTGVDGRTASPAASPSGEASPTPSPAQTSPSMSISDRNGTVKSGPGAVDPSALGVAIYPMAVQSQGGGNFSAVDAGGSSAIATLNANAGFDAVDAWYKSHVPADAQATHLRVGGESTASYEWTSKDGLTDRIVTINTNHGKPIITISMRRTVATPGT